MKEFFGIGGYEREPEGYLSWQHLLFVTSLMVIMTVLAVWLGRRDRNRDEKQKNLVLMVAALIADGLEIFRMVFICFRSGDPLEWLYVLPLFLCSIQFITMPLAAFSKGRVKEAALDFVFIFGLLGALLGTYGAGQNYAAYPVFGYDNIHSGLTHAIAGFASLYVFFSGMTSMKKKNIWITASIVTGFCIVAYITNLIVDYNYMFLMSPDGTPYEIVYSMSFGIEWLYTLLVVVFFYVYIALFYLIYYLIASRVKKQPLLS